ncbi:MAG: hypothetical protein V1913_02225 [Fibrobacterota bacterium]
MTGWLFLFGTLAAWTAIAFIYRRASAAGAGIYSLNAASGAVNLVLNLGLTAGYGGLGGATASSAFWGAMNGLCMLFAVRGLLTAMAIGSLAATWTVMQLCFALATVLSLVYPGAAIQATGVFGIVLAALSVVLLGVDKKKEEAASAFPDSGKTKGRAGRWLVFALMAFLFNGLGAYTLTLMRGSAPDTSMADRLLFVSTMSIAMILAGFIGLWQTREKGVRPGLVNGAAIGVLAFVGTHFSMAALNHVPGFVMYPVTNGGSTLLVTLVSVIFLREKAGGWGWAGLIAGTAGIVLLGI